jgi:signal peptidase I
MRRQQFLLGNHRYTLWFPPPELPPIPGVPPAFLLFVHARVDPERVYWSGEDVIRLLVRSGDHILVDRFTYNFRRPERGEMVVFRSSGIPEVNEAEHYLKRIVAFEGERVRIGDDRHVRINGERLDAATRGFEGVYSFSGPPRFDEYAGHVNDAVARKLRMRRGWLAPRFPSGEAELTVRPRHCFVLGDNTMGSEDSRRWGDIPEANLLGRYLLVYWPVSDRFGWVQQ